MSLEKIYNKKGFFFILGIFILWLSISSYWYTCGIKNLCKEDNGNGGFISKDIVNKDIKNSFISSSIKEKTSSTKERKIVCTSYIQKNLNVNSNNIKEVKKIQSYLNEFEKENIPVNGSYGPLTIEAIVRFQKGLDTSNDIMFGSIDSYTREAINKNVCLNEVKNN